MADVVCSCGRCRMRGVMGPVVLITLGALFLAGQFGPYPFWRIWPVLLIVIGLVRVVSALIPAEGHQGPGTPQGPQSTQA